MACPALPTLCRRAGALLALTADDLFTGSAGFVGAARGTEDRASPEGRTQEGTGLPSGETPSFFFGPARNRAGTIETMRIWRDLTAVGVLLLATRCAVSFKDYPVGDTHASAAGSTGLDASSGGSGGTTANGGSGGRAGTGGSGTGGTATGGSAGTGGSSATGGKPGTGGSSATGGVGGVAGSGTGGNGVGGTSATGGVGGTSATGGAGGGCTGTVDSDNDSIPDNCEQLLWSHEVKSDATGNYKDFSFTVLMGEKTMGGQACGTVDTYPWDATGIRINTAWFANAGQLATCMTDGILDTVYFAHGASNQQVESDTESNYGMGNPDLAGHTITQFRLMNNSFSSDCTSSTTTCTVHYDVTWQARGY